MHSVGRTEHKNTELHKYVSDSGDVFAPLRFHFGGTLLLLMRKTIRSGRLEEEEARGCVRLLPCLLSRVAERWGDTWQLVYPSLLQRFLLFQKGVEKRWHQQGSLGLLLPFLILALGSLHISPPSYWLGYREEKRHKSFLSPLELMWQKPCSKLISGFKHSPGWFQRVLEFSYQCVTSLDHFNTRREG